MSYQEIIAARARALQPTAAAGPEVLDGDMTGADVVEVLQRLKSGPLLIRLDLDARNYLVDAVLARIGGRSQ